MSVHGGQPSTGGTVRMTIASGVLGMGNSLMSDEDENKPPISRRAAIAGLAAALLTPTPALAQGLFCPRGGYHLWVLYAIDRKSGRTVMRCMKCGVFKIG